MVILNCDCNLSWYALHGLIFCEQCGLRRALLSRRPIPPASRLSGTRGADEPRSAGRRYEHGSGVYFNFTTKYDKKASSMLQTKTTSMYFGTVLNRLVPQVFGTLCMHLAMS